MKSEKGITLTSLVIYIVVATLIISTMAVLSTFFFNNINLVKDQDKYAPEFNKFVMFFVEDVKSNKKATVTNNQVIFADGDTYTYNSNEQKIYRNDTVIAKNVELASFTLAQETSDKNNTTKNIITVRFVIKDFDETMDFVLRYW